MELSGIKISGTWFYVFPPLFAVVPIFFLYSQNVQELLISQLFVPVAVAGIATILCWVCLSFLLKDTLKAGVIITLFIFLFYTYGTLFDWLVSLNLFTVKHRQLVPVILVFAAYLGYFVYPIKSRDLMINVAKILTVLVAVLLILNIVNIIPHELEKNAYANQKPVITENQLSGNQTDINQSAKYPDIYYFILDEGASSDTIKEVFDYDNHEFTDGLKRKGFYIAQNSSTRYDETMASLATSLNMEYAGGKISRSNFASIAGKDAEFEYLGFSKTELYNKVSYNKVSSFLKSKGYTLVVIDNCYSRFPAKGRMMSDISYNYIDVNTISVIDDFSLILIKNSMLKPFTYIFELQQPLVRDTYTITRYSTLYTFSKMPEIEKIQGPKFVFIHFLPPHAPFVFDQKGNEVNRKYQTNWKDKIYYRDQYIYITNQISSVVDRLLDTSKDKPVIIIQSDHGPRSGECGTPDECMSIPLDDKFKIFNAYYFPGNCSGSLYQNISPVNTFRVTFNCYFNGNYTLLEDE